MGADDGDVAVELEQVLVYECFHRNAILPRLGVHALHDGERFQAVAAFAQVVAARLEALLDGDADALHRGARLADELDEAVQRASVRQEVVDDQHMVVGVQELLRHDDVVHATVRERLDACREHLAVQVDALSLLCEHHRHAEMARHHAGDADAGRLDREDLRDGSVGEQPLELLAHRVEQIDVQLVVEEAVHLEDALRLHHPVAPDAFLQKLHVPPPSSFRLHASRHLADATNLCRTV